jgi:hypothetical protein
MLSNTQLTWMVNTFSDTDPVISGCAALSFRGSQFITQASFIALPFRAMVFFFLEAGRC